MQHEQYGQPYHRIAPSPLTNQEEITQLFCCTEKAIKALKKCAKRHKAAHRVNDRGKI